MSHDSFRLVAEYTLHDYPCGLSAGMRLRIAKEIMVTQDGGKTEKIFPVGELWTVLPGVADEPAVIWLKQADGARHTWDAHDILETFQRADE